jgi:NADH dehydrogenase FAD-containing subunit
MKNFPIVCVGGSAGGLDAYIRLLKYLPGDMGVAIIIVNHITKFPTLLHEIEYRFTIVVPIGQSLALYGCGKPGSHEG